MIGAEPYNQAVRDTFHSPAHAGDLSRDYPHVLRAVAAESENGSRLVLAAGVADELILEMRYRVWGCPHLIAAAEILCKEREQAAVAGLSVFALAELMELLAIPVEKTGRILLLEDALNLLWEQYSGAD
jgi:nitrogen fixation NifU-like protein